MSSRRKTTDWARLAHHEAGFQLSRKKGIEYKNLIFYSVNFDWPSPTAGTGTSLNKLDRSHHSGDSGPDWPARGPKKLKSSEKLYTPSREMLSEIEKNDWSNKIIYFWSVPRPN